jgi:hypothetical protein
VRIHRLAFTSRCTLDRCGLLICLECREIKMFGPTCELHCDLSIEAEQGLSQLLSLYQKNRPTTKATR